MRLSIKKILLVLSIIFSIILFSCEKQKFPENKPDFNLDFSGITVEKTNGIYHYTANLNKEGGEFTVSCSEKNAEHAVISSVVINDRFSPPDPNGDDWPFSPVIYSNREWGWIKSEYFKNDNICATTIHILPNETGASRNFLFYFGCCVDHALLYLTQAAE